MQYLQNKAYDQFIIKNAKSNPKHTRNEHNPHQQNLQKHS